MTSDKDIERHNAEHENCKVEYERKCKECNMPYWTSLEAKFCSDSCKELYEKDKEMTEYYRRELKIEDLIHDFHKEEL